MIIWVVQLRRTDEDGRARLDVLGCASSVSGAEALVETHIQVGLLGLKPSRLYKEDGSIQLAHGDLPFLSVEVSARPYAVYDSVPSLNVN
jgi:hypothetical protein